MTANPNLRVTEIKAFVPAKDFARSKEFYKDIGFTMASDGGGIAYFHFGHASFLLQDFYVESLAKNFMMHMLVEDVDAWRVRIKDSKNKIYHARWSPDGQFVSFSRGPDGEGDLSKPGTFQAACEIMGVYAPGWDIGVVSAVSPGTNDLETGSDADFTMLTTNGMSNKS